MATTPKISPFLWFDHQAEEAANFYVSIFPNSKITRITRYGKAGHEHHGQRAGTVMTVSFKLDGQEFTALNGGPVFQFNEAVSLVINCGSQREVDYYWEKLTAGGDKEARQCGWLKDKFGVSWQVIPTAMNDLLGDPDDPRSERAISAMMKMEKLDLAALEKAFNG